MRAIFPNEVESNRFQAQGRPMTKRGDRFGAFVIRRKRVTLFVMASEADGSDYNWDHVSVSTASRSPTWEEMCYVKDLFFDDEECVLQFHPPKSKYVNMHEYCLHLWRPAGVEIPMPKQECV